MPCGSGPWPVLALATRTLVSGPWPRRALVAGRWSLWLWRWCGKPPRTIRALHNSAQLPVSSAKQRDELAAAHSIALDASSVAPSRCCTSPSTDSAQAYGLVAEQFRHPQPASEFGQTNADDEPHLTAGRQPSTANRRPATAMQTVACAVFPAEASPMPPAIFHIRCTRPVEGPISWALLASVATLHDRQIRRLRALEDATGVDADVAIQHPLRLFSRAATMPTRALGDGSCSGWSR